MVATIDQLTILPEGLVLPQHDDNAQVKQAPKDVAMESSYWNNFYSSFDIAVPSQFCVMLATEADKSVPVVEFGCGNGRDSIYLSRHGFQVFAGDLSHEAIVRNQEKDQSNPNAVNFSVCDVSKADQVRALVHKARAGAGTASTTVNLYNRFFLHSIDDQQERLFLTAVSAATTSGDTLYMEFRCSLDAHVEKIYKDHYRRYIDTNQLVIMMEEELEFDVTYVTTGQGMAKYKNEDPFVSRIIAKRR